MKKIKYFIFILISIFILSENINALTYSTEISSTINNAISYKDYYITIKEENSNTIIEKLNYKNESISSKQLTSLTNAELIKYQSNYLVVGKNNNNLELYLFDENNTILNTNKTDIIIPNSKFNLVNYDNKIYLYLTNDTILTNNIIYEIDSNLTITEKNLSFYNNLKDILGSNYEEINNTGEIIDNKIYYYNESLKTDKYQILVGYNDLNQSVIKLTNTLTNENLTKEDLTCSSYLDIELVNNEIIILCKNINNETELKTYDSKLNLIESKIISLNEPKKILKLKNNLLVITDKNQLFYTYDTNIIKEESLFGTLNIAGTSIPYETISYEIIPNSGYEVESISVKDEYGNIIEIKENKFIMPESNVYINIVYKENVTNPNTIDSIYIIIIVFVLAIIGIKYAYTKYKWLS